LLDAKDRTSIGGVIGDEVADSLISAWEETRAEARVVEWLDKFGFPARLAGKVVKLWGAHAPEKVQENPYRMLAVARWDQVDAAAKLLGVHLDAEIRQIAAVEATCYRSMGDKHTVIEEQDLLKGVSSLLGMAQEGARKALELASADLAVIQVGEGRWQALGPWVMEFYVKDRVAKMVAAEFVPSGHLLWSVPNDSKVDSLINEFQAESTLQLTEEQKQAVWLALTQRFGLLLGGAGTGKTTVLKAVQWAVSKQEGTVHAIALAGRAAIRMQEATGYPARTIAGFLGAAERGEVVLGGGNLIVVDEASMVDLPLMYSLLRVVPEDARILLVGDPYQLPPIGMGLVFSVYCEDDRAPKVQLTQVHRQARETGIPILAAQIRNGEMPTLGVPSGPGMGISFIPCSPAEAQAEAIEVLGSLGGPGGTQILGAIKNGPTGINVINTALHNLRATGKDTWEGFAVDDPVIYLENDYDRRIWNGTLGMVQAAGPAGISVLWDGHDKGMSMDRGDLENMDLAYAISVHKAQGSQFRRVIVPVFKSRLLDRTLIYTALTRATEQVVFFGDEDALKQAVEAPPAPHRRNHGLGQKHSLSGGTEANQGIG
jgi:exodeoxyribonuclease V alpha subunit